MSSDVDDKLVVEVGEGNSVKNFLATEVSAICAEVIFRVN